PLPLRLLLTAGVATRTRLDPLRVEAERVINGRAQRGMLAAALRDAGRDRELDEWVARGGVWFAPAFPRLEAGVAAGGAGGVVERTTVAVPAPATLFRSGADDTGDAVDLERVQPSPGVAYRALGGLLAPEAGYRAAVAATAEQYLGRGRGDGTGRGAPFFTTTLDAGQVFETRWQMWAADGARLDALAWRVVDFLTEARGRLVLGAAGARAHGGEVRVDLAEDAVRPGRPVAADRIGLTADRDWPAGEERDLVLLSPALVCGAGGGFHPRALVAAVARRFPGTAVEVVTAHVEAQAVGGYHRGYRGPVAERWAARPGSVVRLRPNRPLTTEQVRALEAHPLGERAADGYGQFAVLAVRERVVAPVEVAPVPGGGGIRLADGTEARIGAASPAGWLQSDRDLGRLYDTLLANAAAEPVRAFARRLAAVDDDLRGLTPSLLGRLREVAAAPHPTAERALRALADAVGERDAPGGPGPRLRGKALEKVADARVRVAGHRVPVRDWFAELARDPRRWWDRHAGADARLASALAEALVAVDLTHPTGVGADLTDAARDWRRRHAARLALLLVATWLAELARNLREAAGRDGEGRRGES
uniref:hypothetical protein n=1 Tax=Thermobifida halotolerans TaxID=483545 RepID=UPI000A061228